MSTMVTSSRTCTIFLSIGINLIQRRSVATAFILSNPSSFLERKKTDDRFSTGNERVSNSRLLSSVDDYGRRVRKSTSDWDEDNYSGDAKQSSSEKSDSDQGINGRQDDSWDDFDPWQAPQESRGPQRRNNNQNTDDKYTITTTIGIPLTIDLVVDNNNGDKVDADVVAVQEEEEIFNKVVVQVIKILDMRVGLIITTAIDPTTIFQRKIDLNKVEMKTTAPHLHLAQLT